MLRSSSSRDFFPISENPEEKMVTYFIHFLPKISKAEEHFSVGIARIA
jgi:hypothetical protein